MNPWSTVGAVTTGSITALPPAEHAVELIEFRIAGSKEVA
jgi:hypothetical protein